MLLTLLGCTGAVLGVWVFVIRKRRIGCPNCGAIGEFVLIDRNTVGVDCETCGLVYANILTDFRVTIEEHEDDEPMEVEDAGSRRN